MARSLPLVVAAFCFTLAHNGFAQQTGPAGSLATASRGSTSGEVSGTVVDDAGRGLGAASVVAMGAVVAIVKTDEQGRFTIRLDAGRYVLRVARPGFVSTYREVIQIAPATMLTRTIGLSRTTPRPAERVALASLAQPPEGDDEESSPDSASTPPLAAPSETAWRLRHLPRTALRDETASPWGGDAHLPPARSSRLVLTDLTGRVDVVTTSAVGADGSVPGADWPRSVAYVALGAPVGTHGDWSVRTSLAGGEASAWTLAGDYQSDADGPHAFRAGVSYSAQTFTEPALRHSLAAIDTVRRVGSVHFSDEWRLPIGLSIESGVRVDRYDYLVEPTLVSARLGVSQRLPGRLTIVAIIDPRMVAPGAEEFAVPDASGVWLPPERTFSSLNVHTPLRAQEIESYETGLDLALAGTVTDEPLALRIRRFRESSSHQVATIFGLDDASRVGHYYLGSPGGVDVDGWQLGVAGRLTSGIVASVDYARTTADWHRSRLQSDLRRVARATARRGTERLHDLTTSLEAHVPATSTRVHLALRVNSGFSDALAITGAPAARFAVEVRQLLPFRPLGHGDVNVLFSARTLFHDAAGHGGYYDELLTVAPPVRFTCGLQVRF
jgi:hypothetical protein